MTRVTYQLATAGKSALKKLLTSSSYSVYSADSLKTLCQEVSLSNSTTKNILYLLDDSNINRLLKFPRSHKKIGVMPSCIYKLVLFLNSNTDRNAEPLDKECGELISYLKSKDYSDENYFVFNGIENSHAQPQLKTLIHKNIINDEEIARFLCDLNYTNQQEQFNIATKNSPFTAIALCLPIEIDWAGKWIVNRWRKKILGGLNTSVVRFSSYGGKLDISTIYSEINRQLKLSSPLARYDDRNINLSEIRKNFINRSKREKILIVVDKLEIDECNLFIEDIYNELNGTSDKGTVAPKIIVLFSQCSEFMNKLKGNKTNTVLTLIESINQTTTLTSQAFFKEKCIVEIEPICIKMNDVEIWMESVSKSFPLREDVSDMKNWQHWKNNNQSTLEEILQSIFALFRPDIRLRDITKILEKIG